MIHSEQTAMAIPKFSLYDGARLIQITKTYPGDMSSRHVNGNFQPSISDDGRYIDFSSNRNSTNQNSDSNLEIFVYDTIAANFIQTTNSSVMVGFTSPKVSGDGTTLVFIRDTGTTPSANRDLVRQNRATLTVIGLPATQAPGLALTYGRAVSDDGHELSGRDRHKHDGCFCSTAAMATRLARLPAGIARNRRSVYPTISGDGTRVLCHSPQRPEWAPTQTPA